MRGTAAFSEKTAGIPLLLLLFCLAVTTTHALEPGSTNGTCAAVGFGDAFVQYVLPDDFVSYADDIDAFGNQEAASFGRLTLYPTGQQFIYITTTKHRQGVVPYAAQRRFSYAYGGAELCRYIHVSAAGRGVCAGDELVVWFEYDQVSGQFSVTETELFQGASFLQARIHKDRAFLYDANQSRFVVRDWNGFQWVPSAVPELFSAAPYWAESYRRDEIAVLNAAGDFVEIYYSSGPTVQLFNLYSVPVSANVVNFVFTRDDQFAVVESTAVSTILFHERVNDVIQPAPSTGIVSGDPSVGSRLCATDQVDGEAYLVAAAPTEPSLTSGAAGSLHIFIQASPGGAYVFHGRYENGFLGTGVTCNNIGRSLADAKLSYSTDPFLDSYYYYYLPYANQDEADGRAQVACLEPSDCDGSCGLPCDSDDDACSIDELVYGVCQFSQTVDLTSSDPCVSKSCVASMGIIVEYLSGPNCEISLAGTVCEGVCIDGGCDPDFGSCLVITATPTPTGSPSPGASASPSPSLSNSPSVSLSRSTTPSTSASQTSTISVTATPSVTADSTPSSTNTATVTPTQSSTATTTQSTSASPSATVGCGGLCAPFEDKLCNVLWFCDGYGNCYHSPSDQWCRENAPASQCYESVCLYDDDDFVGNPTGCRAVPLIFGFPCNTDRPCLSADQCDGEGNCTGTPDDSRCDASQNGQCGTNKCIEDLSDSNVDALGCRMQAPPGPCISDDACVVHTGDTPTFCDPVTFECVGGAEIQCDSGEVCSLGVCVDESTLDTYDTPPAVETGFSPSPTENDVDDDDDGGGNDDGTMMSGVVLFLIIGVFIVALMTLIFGYLYVSSSSGSTRSPRSLSDLDDDEFEDAIDNLVR